MIKGGRLRVKLLGFILLKSWETRQNMPNRERNVKHAKNRKFHKQYMHYTHQEKLCVLEEMVKSEVNKMEVVENVNWFDVHNKDMLQMKQLKKKKFEMLLVFCHAVELLLFIKSVLLLLCSKLVNVIFLKSFPISCR